MPLYNEKRGKSGDCVGCHLFLTDGQKGQSAQLNSAKKIVDKDVKLREKRYLFGIFFYHQKSSKRKLNNLQHIVYSSNNLNRNPFN